MKHKANIAKYQKLEITGEKTSIYSTFHFSEDFQKKKETNKKIHTIFVQ